MTVGHPAPSKTMIQAIELAIELTDRARLLIGIGASSKNQVGGGSAWHDFGWPGVGLGVRLGVLNFCQPPQLSQPARIKDPRTSPKTNKMRRRIPELHLPLEARVDSHSLIGQT
jgi:hypothetical protein